MIMYLLLLNIWPHIFNFMEPISVDPSIGVFCFDVLDKLKQSLSVSVEVNLNIFLPSNRT